VLRLLDRGLRAIVSVHDFSLFCASPHLLERSTGAFCDYSDDAARCGRCLGEQLTRRALARELLGRAEATIFPSRFLRNQHRSLFGLEGGRVIEPGADERPRQERRERSARIAFAGSFQRHKGAHLLPDLARAGGEWHVFGGGDEALLRRARRHATIHGWYGLGALPRLLERHAIDLVVLPSIVPESYGLTLSESRRAGIPAVAFAHGALGERIASQGGGWLAPLEGGSDALLSIIHRWRTGELTTEVPNEIASPRRAAAAHVELYRELGG
jgi:glycosyltransferase involved in cell wall biosynthesis